MKIQLHLRLSRFLVTTVMTLAALFIMGSTLYGQGGGPTPRGSRDVSGSEATLSALESESKHAKRDAQTIMAEVNEDFSSLRAINETLKAAASSNGALDYKAILDNAVELKKRGSRLRSNLAALPKAEKEEKRAKELVPADDAQMRGLLGSLNGVLTAFLTNPIFSDMGSLDNQLALKARRDLEIAIDMSDVVRNGADKLGKRKP